MVISVASGKGGTGKTYMATALALAIDKSCQFLDCDVEEPNSSIFLKPAIQRTTNCLIQVPEVDYSVCKGCQKCTAVCAYHALTCIDQKITILDQLCHSCGSCVILCPANAMKTKNTQVGMLRSGRAGRIEFCEGKLDIGSVSSPFIIQKVIEQKRKNIPVIIDCPPGTSCPMIAAVKESDYCILVTEATPFGLHDLSLAVDVLKELAVPFGVIINKTGIGNHEVQKYCRSEAIDILFELPFNTEIAHAYSEGTALIDIFPGYRVQLCQVYHRIKRTVKENNESIYSNA